MCATSTINTLAVNRCQLRGLVICTTNNYICYDNPSFLRCQPCGLLLLRLINRTVDNRTISDRVSWSFRPKHNTEATRMLRSKIVSRVSEGQGRHGRAREAPETLKKQQKRPNLKFEISFFYIFLFSFFSRSLPPRAPCHARPEMKNCRPY